MKYLLILLLLTGCVDQNLYKQPITPERDPGLPSTGLIDGFSWRCSEMEVNEKLVWIECKFFNKSLVTQRNCIQVGYSLNDHYEEVVHSRKICSATLDPNETFENYVAFIKEKRNLLTEKCGPELDRCYMTSKVVAGVQ